jgi:hypothetical protein
MVMVYAPVYETFVDQGRVETTQDAQRESQIIRLKKAFVQTVFCGEEEEEEFNRLPWLGRGGRAAAGCACTAAALRC